MPRNRSLFTPERIAVLTVCVLAIAAILYFATRPAPTVHHIVTGTTDLAVKGDTVIVLKSKDAHKRSNHKRSKRKRATRSSAPHKSREPKERDYSQTPEAEKNMTTP